MNEYRVVHTSVYGYVIGKPRIERATDIDHLRARLVKEIGDGDVMEVSTTTTRPKLIGTMFKGRLESEATWTGKNGDKKTVSNTGKLLDRAPKRIWN